MPKNTTATAPCGDRYGPQDLHDWIDKLGRKTKPSDNDTKRDAASGGDRESYQNPARIIFRMR